MRLLEAGKRGDPMAAVTWNILSLRNIEGKLAARGFAVKKDAVARMMRAEGYSLQGMSRVKEGKQHPDRDAQFGRINDMIDLFILAGQPVISTDTKKKELIGEYGRAGRTWQPAGQPVQVRDHDFPEEDTARICPYGIYDIAANTGFVSVGTSHDTGAFAVNAIRLWWQHEGCLRYRDAEYLLITCDAGGSSGHRCRLWRQQLTELSQETGLSVIVLHFPPGTSKWNKVEHRLFCHITRTWSQAPLLTLDDAVAGIAAATACEGLKVTAMRDDAEYPVGTEISDRQNKDTEDRFIDRDPGHGGLCYLILPRPRAVPEPEPGPAGPDPALTAALAVLAGIPGLQELRERAALDWTAAREHQLTLKRGGTRRQAGNAVRLPRQRLRETVRAGHPRRRRLPRPPRHDLGAPRPPLRRPPQQHQRPRRRRHHRPGETRHHPPARRSPHQHARQAPRTRRSRRNHPHHPGHRTRKGRKPAPGRHPRHTRDCRLKNRRGHCAAVDPRSRRAPIPGAVSYPNGGNVRPASCPGRPLTAFDPQSWPRQLRCARVA